MKVLVCNLMASWALTSQKGISLGSKLILLILVLQVHTSMKCQTLTRDHRLRANFELTIEDRYGIDENANGLIDLENSFAYVNPLIEIYGEPRYGLKLSTILGNGYIPLTSDLDVLNDVKRREVFSYWRQREKVIIDSIHIKVDDEVVHRVEIISTLDPKMEIIVNIPEGYSRISLWVFGRNQKGERIYNEYSESIEFDDILIVAMGDSYSSGEGNPDYNQNGTLIWADGVTPAMGIQHELAHRSNLAWSAQFANLIEKRTKFQSVTYVNVASSGASIQSGILESQKEGLPAQLDQVTKTIGNRTIDMLLISIGGNDVGFAQLLGALAIRTECNEIPYGINGFGLNFGVTKKEKFIKDAINSGNWQGMLSRRDKKEHFFDTRDHCNNLFANHLPRLSEFFGNTPGLNALSNQFELLNMALGKLQYEQVYMMEYPSLGFTNRDPESSQVCGDLIETNWFLPSLVGSDLGTLEYIVADGIVDIDRGETRFAHNNFLYPINNKIREACERYGWTSFSGILDLFRGHSVCNENISDYRTDNLVDNERVEKLNESIRAIKDLESNWYRLASESLIRQGDGKGAAHPNEYGNAAIANALFRKEASKIIKPIVVTPLRLFVDEESAEINLFSSKVEDVCDTWRLGGGGGVSAAPISITNRYKIKISEIKNGYPGMPIDYFKVEYTVLPKKGATNLKELLPGQSFVDQVNHIELKRNYDEVIVTFLDESNLLPIHNDYLLKAYYNYNSVALSVSKQDGKGNPIKETVELSMKNPPPGGFDKYYRNNSIESLEGAFDCFQDYDVVVDPCGGIVTVFPSEGGTPLTTPIDPRIVTTNFREEMPGRENFTDPALQSLIGTSIPLNFSKDFHSTLTSIPNFLSPSDLLDPRLTNPILSGLLKDPLKIDTWTVVKPGTPPCWLFDKKESRLAFKAAKKSITQNFNFLGKVTTLNRKKFSLEYFNKLQLKKR